MLMNYIFKHINIYSDECKKSKCDYYFTVDSTVHLDNPETLKFLIEQNK